MDSSETLVDQILNKKEESAQDNSSKSESDIKVTLPILSNIVKKEKLREVQSSTLNIIKEALENTYGPMGSNTVILTGSDKASLLADYSKDGHKVLKAITFADTIEMSIQSQLVDITQHVEKEVGDGTTSAVMLSNAIFQKLCKLETESDPYTIIRQIKNTVSQIQKAIESHKREVTLDDIYDICMISTNGNEEISKNIQGIYKDFGLDVYIDTTISTTKDNQIKIYDGLTLDEGYSDPVYINTKDGKSSIRDAHVYAFNDPIDTPEMISLFEKIIADNCIIPSQGGDDPIPTVIIAPKISRDMCSLMEQFVDYLYGFEGNAVTQKPPVLVITNLGINLDKYFDIARLCGCKMIRKYNDPKIQEADVAKGLAPTLENVSEFFGTAELVESDVNKTKFINPGDMFVKDEDGFNLLDEDGNPVPTNTYSSLMTFLQAELDNAMSNSSDANVVGTIRKRVQSLKSNMVEYQVGGINISDRDSLKDLVEDAVKNCRSASVNGVGYAANFEGLRAAVEVAESCKDNTDCSTYVYAKLIIEAYIDIISILYKSANEDSKELIKKSLSENCPFNLRTLEFDKKVLTAITTDINILDAISKIITIMFTSNQALVQSPHINKYI